MHIYKTPTQAPTQAPTQVFDHIRRSQRLAAQRTQSCLCLKINKCLAYAALQNTYEQPYATCSSHVSKLHHQKKTKHKNTNAQLGTTTSNIVDTIQTARPNESQRVH